MLSFKRFIAEAKEVHGHVAFLGAAPNTHMGHIKDIIKNMGPGKKFIGLSGKSTVFSDEERADIANKQSGGEAETKVEKTAGQTVGRAYNNKVTHLHLHFGIDRKPMAERLKSSIEAGKIPEMGGGQFKEVHLHYPEDENRSHGLSGTKMRKAANEGDIETYHKHVGSVFSRPEAVKMMKRTKASIDSGETPLIRK